MNKEKIRKLESISLQLVSNFIFEELDEKEKFSIVSVTGVKISSDLSYLDVFVNATQNWEFLTKNLAKYWYNIQKKLNKTLEIRKIPKIRFRYDNSWAKAEEINKQINKLKISL